MIKIIGFFLVLNLISFGAYAQKSSRSGRKERIIYKYKKYEKFDLDDFSIMGDWSSPGDLSIDPRYQQRFKNRLPYRKNFNPEIRRSIEAIK